MHCDPGPSDADREDDPASAKKYARYASGVPGGPNNPLASRVLYLYRNGRDSYYRIHGTNEPWTIGKAVSTDASV